MLVVNVYTTKWMRSRKQCVPATKRKKKQTPEYFAMCIVRVIMSIFFLSISFLICREHYALVPLFYKSLHAIASFIYITMIKIKHDKWQREITLVRCAFCFGLISFDLTFCCVHSSYVYQCIRECECIARRWQNLWIYISTIEYL